MDYGKIVRSVLATSSMVLLVACSGGGSSGSSSSSASVEEGLFLDAAVAGLGYESGDLSGTTGDDGSFEYESGETVRFFLGDIEIGSTTGNGTVTPLDLVSDAADESDPHVVNILRFLQTLDDDGDLSNGIQITQVMRDLAAGRSINFDQTTDAFASDADMLSTVNELTSASNVGARDLVEMVDALAHFQETLASLEVDGNLDPNDGELLTEAQFIDAFAAQVDGVFRLKMIGDFSASLDFTGVAVNSSVQFDNLYLQAYERAGDSFFVDACSLTEPEDMAIDPEEYEPDTEEFCESSELKYYQNASNVLSMEVECDGSVAWRGTWTKISDLPTFTQGNLSFSSSMYPPLDSTSGVCGSLTQSAIASQYLPQPNDLQLTDDENEGWQITVISPYADSERVKLYMTFNGDAAPGTYHVYDDSEDVADAVDVLMSSAIYGGSAEEPSSQSADSGTVTITSVTGNLVSGSFDLLMGTGDTVEGSFSVDFD